MHPSFGLWRLIKSKSRLAVELDHLPLFQFTLHFHLSTKRQSTKFSFRSGLDVGAARKALASTLEYSARVRPR